VPDEDRLPRAPAAVHGARTGVHFKSLLTRTTTLCRATPIRTNSYRCRATPFCCYV
jgi:hypothetical protein